MEAALLDLSVEATSVRDDAAVEVDPRVSLPWAAWKRDTVDFAAAVVGVGVSASGRARS